jgi:hypothetical protein
LCDRHVLHELRNIVVTTIGRIAIGGDPRDEARFARERRRRGGDEARPGALGKEIERQIVESDMRTVSES